MVKVIHDTGDAARQEHSRSTEIDRLPVPPVGPKLLADAETFASQRVDAGAVMFVEVVAELPHAVVTNSDPNSRVREEITSAAVAQRSPAVLVHVLSFSSPAEHTLSNHLRFPGRQRLRELCTIAAMVIVTGCGGAHTLGPARHLAL